MSYPLPRPAGQTLPADRPVPIQFLSGVGWFEILYLSELELGDRASELVRRETEMLRIAELLAGGEVAYSIDGIEYDEDGFELGEI